MPLNQTKRALLRVGDQVGVSDKYRDTATIGTVSRVTKTRIVVELGKDRTPLSFMIGTGREVGGGGAWRTSWLLSPTDARERNRMAALAHRKGRLIRAIRAKGLDSHPISVLENVCKTLGIEEEEIDNA